MESVWSCWKINPKINIRAWNLARPFLGSWKTRCRRSVLLPPKMEGVQRAARAARTCGSRAQASWSEAASQIKLRKCWTIVRPDRSDYTTQSFYLSLFTVYFRTIYTLIMYLKLVLYARIKSTYQKAVQWCSLSTLGGKLQDSFDTFSYIVWFYLEP